MGPTWSWDEEARAGYVAFDRGAAYGRTVQRSSFVNEDYDEDGELIGVEIFAPRLLPGEEARGSPTPPPEDDAKTTAIESAGSAVEPEGVTSREPPLIPPKKLGTSKSLVKSEKSKSTQRGQRLPEDWEPSPDLLAWGAENVPDVDLQWHTADFKDYWAARTGPTSTKKDWNAAWRNWMRKQAGQRPRGRPPVRESTADAKARQTQSLKELFRGQ